MSDEREMAIRERAYALWEKGGSTHGQHGEHWDEAVRQIDAEAAAKKEKPGRKSAAKPATSAAVTPVAKARPASKPATAPAAVSAGKAKQAADKVVATVKRATKGTAKK